MEHFDLSLSNEKLADQIAQLQDGTDLWSCLKNLCVGPTYQQDPRRYARIFWLVSKREVITPWMRLACEIQEVNGLRRDPAELIEPLADNLGEIEKGIENLTPGHQQWSLGAEANYNRGLLFRMLRQYDQAALSQTISAMWYFQAGETAKGHTGLFAAQLERASAALVRGNKDEILASLEALCTVRNLVRTITGDSYPVWMRENASIHIWWAHLMAGVEYDEKEDDKKAVAASSFSHWAKCAQMGDKIVARTATADEALDLANELEGTKSSSMANVVLTLRLFAASAMPDAERFAILQDVTKCTGPDGGVPMAVANRLMAEYVEQRR